MDNDYSLVTRQNDGKNGCPAQPARVFADLSRIGRSSAVTALEKLAIAVLRHPAGAGEVAVIHLFWRALVPRWHLY
jgi:hypothetical protein